ncbi:MAG TPA: GH1 family beta-glucosidase [Kineosporiaceae bacterium]
MASCPVTPPPAVVASSDDPPEDSVPPDRPDLPDLGGLPTGFRWGAATAAFAVEGDAEHRGRSIWDQLCERPGWIADGSDGSVACDHIHRYAADVALMRDLGLDAYRFSISWPRVQPGGAGRLAASGLAFYDHLVDALLAAGVEPWATLYHWDLPVEVQAVGGWAERDVVDRFTDYAVSVHAALGDRVRHWVTVNEPWCSAWLGYGSGEHAPGVADHASAARAAHHLLLAHGRAVAALRAQAPADHLLGIVLNLFPVRADASVPEADLPRVQAAVTRIDGLQNRWWLDALLEGRYPTDVLALLGGHLAGTIEPGDLAEISRPLDFLGVNYYHDALVVAAEPDPADARGPYPGLSGVGPAEPRDEATSMGWPVTPRGLRDILVRIGTEHPTAPPLVVTENGSAWEGEGPAVDRQRTAYLYRHAAAVADAVRDGADVRGYFVWSLLDSFEWACGYSQRFGLVAVDFASLERRPRGTFAAYRDLIAGAGGRVSGAPR